MCLLLFFLPTLLFINFILINVLHGVTDLYVRDGVNLESQTFLIEMLKLTSCTNLIS